MGLNLVNAKKEEDEEEEEVNVDGDTDTNLVRFYHEKGSPNETSNVPEDLSKKGNKSIEDSKRYHPYKPDNPSRTQSPNITTPSVEEQNIRQSPSHAVSMN